MRGYYTKFSFCLPLLIGLAACGNPQKDPPKDDPLGRTMDVAGQAVFYDRLQQAEINYKKSYQYALTRDDNTDIENAGYNLAIVQLDLGKLQTALSTVHMVRNDLYIRKLNSSTQLDLVEAAILYRLHRGNEALNLLQNALHSPHEDVKERAYFFSGLIANDNGNLQLLSDSVQKLDQLLAKSKKIDEDSWKADQGELHALLAFKKGNYNEALTTARYVEVSRREQIEYRAMIRALIIQALVNQAQGHSLEAAQLFLRAGKSAALLKDYENARQYLNQVQSLHADELTYRSASQALSALTDEIKKNKQL